MREIAENTATPFTETSIESVLLDADLFVKYSSPEKAFELLRTSLERSPRSISVSTKSGVKACGTMTTAKSGLDAPRSASRLRCVLAPGKRASSAAPFSASRTNIAALFVILFIYGWNQYLWPLLITTRDDMQTIVIGIKKMIVTSDALTEGNVVMATAMLAMLPPVLVVILMQRWFVKGLVETEK